LNKNYRGKSRGDCLPIMYRKFVPEDDREYQKRKSKKPEEDFRGER